MPMFSFIKIVDNQNPSDFSLDVTSMSSYHMRMSALRTQCMRHIEDGVGRWRPIYRYFFLDYSFYRVKKREFDLISEAKLYRDKLQTRMVQERQDRLIAKKHLKVNIDI
jgi:hypothetical protein